MHKPSYSHIINNLYKIKTVDDKLSTTRINSKANTQLKQSIISATNFLPDSASFSERVYCIINNIEERPKCDITDQYLKWSPVEQRYSSSKVKSYKERKIDSSSIKQKYKDIKETFIRKYNNCDFNLLTLDEVKSLITLYKTNIKLWDIFKNYDLFCSVKKYTDFLPEAAQWGERFYCLLNRITDRVRSEDGGYSKYINSVVGYSKFSTKKAQQEKKIQDIQQYVSDQFEILDKITHINEQQSVRIKCKTCNTEKEQLLICGLWQNICCNKCTGYGINRSKAEDEICAFLDSHNISYTRNTSHKTISELDIFIPSKNIAIEYNGILWHSFGSTYPNNAHIEPLKKYKDCNKSQECNKYGIKLITVFETEWQFKQDIVKSILTSKLGITAHTIYARNCSLVKLTKDEKKSFYDLNHIQGNCQSFYDIGLKYDDKIVCALSFSHRKIAKQNKPELVRYCNVLNTTVVGGFSKLLKHALNYLNCDIVSYCDLRYSDGNMYYKNGFELLHRSNPNYFYTKDCLSLESRLKYQKHKLRNLQSFDTSKTETQIMYDEGFRKIYDCGNLTFLYRKK